MNIISIFLSLSSGFLSNFIIYCVIFIFLLSLFTFFVFFLIFWPVFQKNLGQVKLSHHKMMLTYLRGNVTLDQKYSDGSQYPPGRRRLCLNTM